MPTLIRLGPPASAQAREHRLTDGLRTAAGAAMLLAGLSLAAGSGAILLGYPDTTQDADLFLEKSPQSGAALVKALHELSFALTASQTEEIIRGKDFVQLKNGPFDLDLVFAPDGIESFGKAWSRHVEVEGFPICHPSVNCGAGGRTFELPSCAPPSPTTKASALPLIAS